MTSRRGSIFASAVILASSLALSGCGDESAASPTAGNIYAATPEASAQGREVEFFNDLARMAAASDVVLRARVTKIEVGKTYGESAADQFTTRNVTLDPVEVLKGSADDALLYEEHGWYPDGTGYVMNGVQWSAAGDEAWYFLHKKDDGSFRLTSSYGRYNLSTAHFGPSGHHPEHEGPWAPLGAKASDRTAAEAAITRAVEGSVR